jgi:voltage-gated potassium channel
MQVKKVVFSVIERPRYGDGSVANGIFEKSLVTLIILNIAAVVAASFKDLPPEVTHALFWFEAFSVVMFSLEYALRLWTADLLYPKSKHPRLKYALSAMAIIDLLAIAPFYIPFLIPCDLRFIRMLRLFRLLRILKLNRYSDAMNIIGSVVRREKEKLLTTIFFTAIIILFASSIMYYVENEAQPDKFPNIIASVWWAVATLTTVGYGDVYPVTVLGKLLSGLIAVLGIGLVALPTGIISSGFVVEMSKKNDHTRIICPHCGKEITPDETEERR